MIVWYLQISSVPARMALLMPFLSVSYPFSSKLKLASSHILDPTTGIANIILLHSGVMCSSMHAAIDVQYESGAGWLALSHCISQSKCETPWRIPLQLLQQTPRKNLSKVCKLSRLHCPQRRLHKMPMSWLFPIAWIVFFCKLVQPAGLSILGPLDQGGLKNVLLETGGTTEPFWQPSGLVTTLKVSKAKMPPQLEFLLPPAARSATGKSLFRRSIMAGISSASCKIFRVQNTCSLFSFLSVQNAHELARSIPCLKLAHSSTCHRHFDMRMATACNTEMHLNCLPAKASEAHTSKYHRCRCQNGMNKNVDIVCNCMHIYSY